MTTNQSNLLKFFGEDKENQKSTIIDNVNKADLTKRLSVERIYQKKSPLEHILLRPDTYIGSVEPITQAMWIYDGPEVGMVYREITFVPGLYKIFDEILVNAADNKQRDKNMDCIKVEIEPSRNKISIWNNGKGIPVVEHKDEKMFVPSLIFGQLLTSSNYNDEEMKVTGGRNGYGAKLCNIFSTKFIVETFSSEDGKLFKQTWTNNMTKASDANIRAYQGAEFTCITFYPDLAKFKMDVLDQDIVALMSRRVFDVAGSIRGVKVFLNEKKLPVKGFKDYIEQYTKSKQDDDGNPLKVIYENVNERWEVGVTVSNGVFQQMSFVNSIATTKGGRHVDYVAEQIINKLVEAVKKKNKHNVPSKSFQIKSHIWLFVNCLIVNPTFDSQTKENMTLQAKKFGSKCQLSDKFFTQMLKCGIMESILSWINVKAQEQLNQKCSGKKRSKIQGIPKLEDANNAGTIHSRNCTLIVTEGDSAKTLAVSGLSVVGRDNYGVFPLKGKMLNVREATHKQIVENQEINNIIKIMGLQYKKKYESMDDIKTLRYGRIMIMADQDQDGSHIKGLLINFIHHNWPTLLRLPFLEEFITPIVKIFKGKQEKSFYSLPEYEEWKKETPNWNTWKIKYYKGLGTSTAKEAKEYFSDMDRHRIKFRYNDMEDDNAIQLAFSKKMVDERKEWLTAGMEERKHRRELGLPELYLYGKQTTNITYSDFINKELILFSNMDNGRSIPSLIDGLKPGQRKVMYTCFKRNDKREIKVAQLAGSVGEHSAYHHGEASLMGTIVNLAQNFVGSNNINLLQPIGQFGTRLQGGKDAASPRYIFTMLSPLSRKLFSQLDEALLTYLYDDNQQIEPEYYIPILPTVLINGAEGIGTGWSTKIPNYNPREIVENIHRLLRGEEPLTMNPWFKNFKGTIERIDDQHFLVNGEISILGPNKLEITELPVRTWTQTYKEQVLEAMLHGSEKSPALITDYKEYHTDTEVHFVIMMSEEKLSKLKEQGLHKVFKLQTTISTSSMVLFSHNGCIQKYCSPEDILKEFYTVRLKYYECRKMFLEGTLAAEAKKLDNQARFILEKIEGKIIIEDRKKAELIKTLQQRGYESDPVKVWKKSHSKGQDIEELGEGEDESTDGSTPDYHYLLGMNLLSLTMEEKDELLKKRDEKFKELDAMKQKTRSDLWEDDLQAFMEELQATEEKECNEISGKTSRTGKTKRGKCEVKPSFRGERVVPVTDPELKKKYEKLKEKKPRAEKTTEKKSQSNQKSSSDKIAIHKPLSERINNGKEAKNSLKQMTLSFSAVKQEGKSTAAGKGPTSLQSSDSDTSDGSDLEAYMEKLYKVEVKECSETSGMNVEIDIAKKLMSNEVKPSFQQEVVLKYEKVKCEEKKAVKSESNQKSGNHKMGAIQPLSKVFNNPKEAKAGLKQTTLSFCAVKQGGNSAVSLVEKCPSSVQSSALNVISDSSDFQIQYKPSHRKKQRLGSSESTFSSSDDVKTAADKHVHQIQLEDRIFSSTVAQSTSKQKGILSELCSNKDTVHEKKGPKRKEIGKSSKDKPLKVKPVFDAFLKRNSETSDGHGRVSGACSSTAVNSVGNLDFKETALGSDPLEDSDSSIEVLVRKTRAKQIRKTYKNESDSDAESTEKLAMKRTKKIYESDPDFAISEEYNHHAEIVKKRTARKRIVISSEDSD